MIQSENRSIDELVARYELEPTLRDVYVEGTSDAVLIDWILREAGCHNAAVYEINTVEVPAAILAKYGLDHGNKGMVLACCFELEGNLDSADQVTGVVDRDYDPFLGRIYENSLLLWTDFSCMEMYFYDEILIDKFCHFIVRKDSGLAPALIANLSPILQDLFYIRVANEALHLGLSWIEPERQCTIQGGLLQFEPDVYVEKYLNKGAKAAEKGRFLSAIQSAKAIPVDDPRHAINGHDFIQLLAKQIHYYTKSRALAESDAIQKMLAGLADHSALAQQPMFGELIRRVSSK